eukprot:gene8570-biopygen22641
MEDGSCGGKLPTSNSKRAHHAYKRRQHCDNTSYGLSIIPKTPSAAGWPELKQSCPSCMVPCCIPFVAPATKHTTLVGRSCVVRKLPPPPPGGVTSKSVRASDARAAPSLPGGDQLRLVLQAGADVGGRGRPQPAGAAPHRRRAQRRWVQAYRVFQERCHVDNTRRLGTTTRLYLDHETTEFGSRYY